VENLLSGQARREELQLEVKLDHDLPAVQSEERAFKQLTYHLILNSMDRSEAGGIVTVAVGRSGNGCVRLSVTDSGREVTEPIRPEPFEAGSEEEAYRTLAPPLVGLPLCATLAERLGAALTTHADEDGVHFVVELPPTLA